MGEGERILKCTSCTSLEGSRLGKELFQLDIGSLCVILILKDCLPMWSYIILDMLSTIKT